MAVSKAHAEVLKEKSQTKSKSLQVVDFYRFQKREKAREEIEGMRDKFEEDKKVLEEMQKAKRFKANPN